MHPALAKLPVVSATAPTAKPESTSRRDISGERTLCATDMPTPLINLSAGDLADVNVVTANFLVNTEAARCTEPGAERQPGKVGEAFIGTRAKRRFDKR